MKRAILIHGWGSSPRMRWFHREKLRLQKLGYEVTIPKMPNKYFPNKGKWLEVLTEFAPDRGTVVIAHSLGATMTLEYLSKTDKPVGEVFLVACPIPYTAKDSFADRIHTALVESFILYCGYKPHEDWDTIKKNTSKIELLYKKRDFKGPQAQGRYLADKLSCKLTVLNGNDHMNVFNLDLVNKDI